MVIVKCIVEPKPNSLRAGEKLEVGKQYEMAEGDAHRWIRRGVVETVEVKSAKKPESANEPSSDSTAGVKPGHGGRGKDAPAG